MKRFSLLLTCVALAAHLGFAAGGARDFTVDFTDCSEFAGWGPVASTPLAISLVPSGFSALMMGGTASMVIRASSCAAVSVNSSAPRPTVVSHVGIGIVSPDGTGTINNYTLVYLTNNALLAGHFQLAGMPAIFDPDLTYEFTSAPAGGGELYVAGDGPGVPAYFLSGTEGAASMPGPFLANWWYATKNGAMKQSTDFPMIAFGPANVAFHTSRSSLLGKLIGGNTDMNFPYFNARGVYPSAQMIVTVSGK